MIEEDLSKQLGSSPRDREWDIEPELEPYITTLENGGTQSSIGQLINYPCKKIKQNVAAIQYIPVG